MSQIIPNTGTAIIACLMHTSRLGIIYQGMERCAAIDRALFFSDDRDV